MDATTSRLTTADGLSLCVRRWRPEAEARGVVQIAHGMSEHAARYDRFARALTARGYAVIAHDHRGHGRSVRDPSELGHFADHDGWTRAVEDLGAVGELARAAYPGLPHVLFAHSMGSSLALSWLSTHAVPLAGVVLSGPTGVVGPLRQVGYVIATGERLRLGKRGRSWLLQQMSFGDFNKPFEPARTPSDWLSRDPDEVDAYVADPLCGFEVTTQHWRDHLVALGQNAEVARLRRIPSGTPILVIAGDADPVGGNTRQITPLLQRLREAGVRRVDHRFWPGGRHELLNDIVRDEVTDHVLAWIDDVAR